MTTTTSYRFKPWSRLTGDAQKVGEELEAMRQETGTLSPAQIVEAARPKKSLLHGYFEWDNTVAAQKHREAQAAHLLRSIVAVKVSSLPHLEQPTRAFVSVSRARDDAAEDDDAGSYTSLAEAIRVVDYREQLIRGALRDLDAYRVRYQLLSELAGWNTALQTARAELQRIIDGSKEAEAA